MLDLGFGTENYFMGNGQFLNVVDLVGKRIMIWFGRANLEHVQDDL